MKKIGIIMGSDSDLPVVEKAMTTLDEFGVPYEVHVFSAHRTPVEAKEFFNAKVNALPPNSSLVINADEFSSDGVSYSRGDIILKDAYSRVVHIKSQTGGVYFPVKIEQEKDKDDILGKAIDLLLNSEIDEEDEKMEFYVISPDATDEEISKLCSQDPDGYVDSGEDCLTDREGFFVAGDCRSKRIRQVATAAADGAVAALAACDYVDTL